MSRKTVLSRIAASALVLGMVAGFATMAQAQALVCKYITGQFDPLEALDDVTDEFEVSISAIESNSNGSRVTKVSGLALAEFNDIGEIDGGVFVAEVDAKVKDTDDGTFSCVDSALVRGVGGLAVVDEDDGWVIRSNSKLDGRKRSGTVADCSDVLTVGGPCSVHRVNAGLRITAQGLRNNDTPKYDRFTVKQNEIFEAVEGRPPTGGEDVFLVCSCAPLVE